MRTSVRIVLILAAVAGAALVLWLAASSSPRVAQLPDGTTLKVLGTSVGSAQFTTEKPWHRVAKRILPAGLQSLLPNPVNGSCSSSSNSVTIFFEHSTISGALPALNAWNRVAAVDDAGFRFPLEGGLCSFGSGTARQVQGIILLAYPRRQRDFVVQFLGPNDELLASLRFLNPVRGPFPEWTPEPLPLTRTNGPMAVTLESLTERSSQAGHRWVEPKWHLEAVDTRWQHSRPRISTFLDPTGNEGSFLSPGEHAWKLKTTVYRERREDFRDTERLVLSGLPLPDPGGFRAMDLTTNVLGVTFLVYCLAGPGRLVISNRTARTMLPPQSGNTSGMSSGSDGTNTWESWASDRPFLLFEASGLQPNDNLNLRLTSEDGRELQIDESSGYHGRANQLGTRIYQRKFTPLERSKRVSLEITVNRGLDFEFLINPAEIRRSIRPAP